MMRERRGIVIGGVPRSGKSRLSRRLSQELSIDYIPADCLVRAFGDNFPQIGIQRDHDDHLTSVNLAPFLSSYWQSYLDEAELDFICDGFHIQPSLVHQANKNIISCFLGYPSASVDSIFFRLRQFPNHDDWTAKHGDVALKEMIQRFITQSRRLEQECQALHIPFFDVSEDFLTSQEIAFTFLSSHFAQQKT